jgi:lysophospholipase L1-like esterase
MTRKYIVFTIYLIVTVGFLLLAAEFASLRINRSRGVYLPFLFANMKVKSFRPGERFNNLDPHLGYSHGENESRVSALREKYSWYSGFAVYAQKPLDQLDHPLILTLGGSTTDPVFGKLWPEELAGLLVEQELTGTVVNGGTGGYSSSQELLKLIRDGLEFRPDLVISYSGVNDRGTYGALPHPMVNGYQRQLLDNLVRSGDVPYFPNTISLLKSVLSLKPGSTSGLTINLGLAVDRNRGEWLYRNFALMNAVSRESGSVFLAVVQPNAYVGSYEWASDFENNGKPQYYIDSLRSLYIEIGEIAVQPDYVHSFMDIFNGIEGVYKGDGVHTREIGNRVIAENMLELIKKETKLFGEP